jgi:ABC-type bacteriocin/lantibiotic exporter with double-glycine peptidase domain
MTKNYNYFLQENNYDCGIASLLTVFSNIGINVSREKILELINFDKQGISAFDIINIGKKFGCNSYGVKGKITKITKELLPCIAHIIDENNFFHYIVILSINNQKNTIKIMDPAYGILNMSFEEFNNKSTGIFLIFEKQITKAKKDKRFRKIIYNIFSENKKLILSSLFLSFILVFLSLLFSYYLKIVMTNIESKEMIIKIFIFFLLIGLIKNIFDFIKNNIITNINVSIDKNITKKVINHILYLPYNYFTKKTTGELINIMNDVENFKDIIIKIFVLCTVDLFLLTLVIIYISFFNIYYLLLFILLISFFFIITKKFQYLFNDSFKKLKKARIKYSSKIIDYFSAFDTFKNLTIEKLLDKDINQTYDDISKNNKQYLKKLNCYNFLNNLLIDKFYLVIIFISSLFTISGQFELYNIVLLSSLIYMVFGLFSNIFESISMYKIYETSVIRVLDVLDIEEEKYFDKQLEKITKIEYKNVSFSINEHEILNNVNLVLKDQDDLFISGESGVGKTAVCEGLAIAVSTGRVPENMIDKLLPIEIELQIDSQIMKVNGADKKLRVAPFLKKYSDEFAATCTEIRPVFEASGFTVSYDQATKTIKITK